MTLTASVQHALKLYDEGRTGPALRIAGSQADLDRWLYQRAKTEPPPVLPKAAQDKPSPNPPRGKKGRPNKGEGLPERMARVHPELPKPTHNGVILYHVSAANKSRGVEHMKLISRAFQATTFATITIMKVQQHEIIAADDHSHEQRYQDGRASWVATVRALIGDIRGLEIASALYIDQARLEEIERYHRLQMDVDPIYRTQHYKSFEAARMAFEHIKAAVDFKHTADGG